VIQTLDSKPRASVRPPDAANYVLDEAQPWLLDKDVVLQRLAADPAHGLSENEAASRLQRYGENALIEKGVESPFKILLEQLTDPLVLILIGAALVSAVLGEFKSVIAITLIVIANAALGVSQEYRAEKAIAALQKMSAPIVRVRRSGREIDLAPNLLVPGDIVLLEAGSIIPADGRVIESHNMSVQEASLTGESEPIEKSTGPMVNPNITIGDRVNMVYMGTSVTYGRGVAVITSTGQKTELGHIATLIQDVETEQTPLQRRMAELSKALFYLSIGIVAIGTLLGLMNGGALQEVFLNGVAMAVAVVPEGLPAVVTIALALGAQRMLRRNALIRKLPAVETLGSVTTICSDKTGTLTQNKMTARRVYYIAGRDFLDERTDAAPYAFIAEVEAAVVIAAALCNDAQRNGDGLLGDPTETALVELAEKFGLTKAELESMMPRVAEVPFSSERKRMTTIHEVVRVPFISVERDGELQKVPLFRAPAPRYVAFMKGAVDSMLDVSTTTRVQNAVRSLDETESHPVFNPDGARSFRERILKQDAETAEKGLRDLGFGMKILDELPVKSDVDHVEHGFTFLGRVAMIDPPRQEVKEAVRRCNTAGIRPVMITGDHPATAFAIAKELGIIHDASYSEAKTHGHVYTGREITLMSDAELSEAVLNASVFARVSPEHKLNIVQALQQQHHIVAMTGDGVNDAPALKKADIGVAMGITGTAVSKEASAMVLLDDNFATIVAAAEEGRTIYNNVRKFIKYILGSNIGEVGVLFLTQLMRLPLPVNTLQILWMNLVTDGLPALALSVEKGETDSMNRPPYDPRDSVFSRGLGSYLVRAGILIGIMGLSVVLMFPVLRVDGSAVTFGTEVINRLQGQPLPAAATEFGMLLWSTMVFTTLVFAQMGHALAIRSERFPIWKIGYGSNMAVIGAIALTVALQIALLYVPFLRDFFGTVALPPVGFLICVILAVVTYFGVEADKWVYRRHSR
jgi:Ca2+-transporting ATPase